MPLELHPCVESDFLDILRIQTSAFSGGITGYLTPQPVTEEIIKERAEKGIEKFRIESDAHFVKVIDTDQNGKMIAVAKWRINEKERTEEEIQCQLPFPSGEEEARPAVQDFMRHLRESRREFMGTKPFCLLHMLVTAPEEQRRGAGSMLLQWGLEIADRAQLPSYLESSEAGKRLYEKHGFEAVRRVAFDLSNYGGEGTDFNTVMVRWGPNGFSGRSHPKHVQPQNRSCTICPDGQ